jgi:Rps23 Pro-64 3,4-dihydroxylase Tpa1-like proline 4-hydroxylase
MSRREITLERLHGRAEQLRAEWSAKQPFHFVVIDDFLDEAFAEEILAAYPQPGRDFWDHTTYIHQRRKFTLTKGFPEAAQQFFQMTAAEDFRKLVTEITGVSDLIDDPDLVGGGLHQIAAGGFLDVHVDYNFHPRTKLHRRLNLLLYMNKDWRPEYEGYLELWDMETNQRIENIAPLFNRAVIFETNEISYHGHPHPLNTAQGVTRKSLAMYYYTQKRDTEASAPEHNTIYRQTTGLRGYLKTSMAATRAAVERTAQQGVSSLGRNLLHKAYRRMKRLPPENK